MGIDTLSLIGILTVLTITNVTIQEPKEPINLTCETDNECVNKMEACNVFCHSENLNNNQEQQQGRCIKMVYVDNGKYPGCD